eukprot:354988-Chlamydomonas_euryale.AAC.21
MQLETEDLRMAYSATEDGWTPGAFHSAVDGYGATIVLARTSGGALIGGYNPLGAHCWESVEVLTSRRLTTCLQRH